MKSRFYAKSCEGKKSYSTQENANARLILYNGGNSGMRVYFCCWCRFWHVGHDRKAALARSPLGSDAAPEAAK